MVNHESSAFRPVCVVVHILLLRYCANGPIFDLFNSLGTTHHLTIVFFSSVFFSILSACSTIHCHTLVGVCEFRACRDEETGTE